MTTRVVVVAAICRAKQLSLRVPGFLVHTEPGPQDRTFQFDVQCGKHSNCLFVLANVFVSCLRNRSLRKDDDEVLESVLSGSSGA